MKSCSILSLSSRICPWRWDPSLKVRHAATTGLLMPHALPKTALDGTKQYWMFFYSHKEGTVIMISRGSQSAAKITTSTWLFDIYLSTSLTPFLTCFKGLSCWINSHIFLESLGSASGSGLSIFYPMFFFSYCFSSAILNRSMNSCFSSDIIMRENTKLKF